MTRAVKRRKFAYLSYDYFLAGDEITVTAISVIYPLCRMDTVLGLSLPPHYTVNVVVNVVHFVSRDHLSRLPL